VPDPWGRVIATHGDQAAVEFRPLVWDGRLLTLGEPRQEMAKLTLDGAAIAHDIGPVTGSRCTGTGSAIGSPRASSVRCAGSPSGTWTWSTTGSKHSGPLAVLG